MDKLIIFVITPYQVMSDWWTRAWNDMNPVFQSLLKTGCFLWTLRSSARSFARTAHLFACSSLLASLARYAALTRSLARRTMEYLCPFFLVSCGVWNRRIWFIIKLWAPEWVSKREKEWAQQSAQAKQAVQANEQMALYTTRRFNSHSTQCAMTGCTRSCSEI